MPSKENKINCREDFVFRTTSSEMMLPDTAAKMYAKASNNKKGKDNPNRIKKNLKALPPVYNAEVIAR